MKCKFKHLKVMSSSREIGHWKQVRLPTIHPSGCGLSPDLAYAGCFVHRAALLNLNTFNSGLIICFLLQVSVSKLVVGLQFFDITILPFSEHMLHCLIAVTKESPTSFTVYGLNNFNISSWLRVENDGNLWILLMSTEVSTTWATRWRT